jgi:uncharacterized membrane protein
VEVGRQRIVGLVAVLTGVVNLLVVLSLLVALPSPVEIPVSFVVLLFWFVIPGLLLLLAFNVQPGDLFQHLFYAVLLSMLWVMLIGMGFNWLLPLAGIDRPLAPSRILPGLDLAMAVLLASVYVRVHAVVWTRPRPPKARYLLPFALPVLAAMGATSLNNGGTNLFTVVLLVGVLALFVILMIGADKIPGGMIVLTMYSASLALLLMTSLRGWGIAGHDIQIEYFVFQLTKSTWHWSPSAFPDPYNACMSLTVLPTMLSGLLRVDDPYMFKAVYQVLFALCPAAVFLLVRRLSGPRMAVLSVLFFVAFPTYFTDMPMLNRQEIAFLFFAGMMLLLVEDTMTNTYRLVLFGVFGLGVVLSHYSTTYSVLLILGSAAASRLVLERRWFAALIRPLFSLTRRRVPRFIGVRTSVPLVALPMVIALGAGAYAWGTGITHTSEGAAATLVRAVGDLQGGPAEGIKSSDTKSSFFGGSSLTAVQVASLFVEHEEQMRKDEDPKTLYPAATYDRRTITAAPAPIVPTTTVGALMGRIGLDPYALNAAVRGGYAKATQVLLLIGIFALLFARRPEMRLRVEVFAVVIASAVFLVALVLIPTLSLSYGLLRAFQQGLIVLALPTAVGSVTMFRWVLRENRAFVLGGGVGCIFFAISVGLFAEVTGGYIGQLHLHNSGTYYDDFYPHPQDGAAVTWISANLPVRVGVLAGPESDRHGYPRLRTLNDVQGIDNLYPGLIRRQDYVLLGYNPLVKHQAVALYENEAVTFTLPSRFFDVNKNLIYSSGSARVYR